MRRQHKLFAVGAHTTVRQRIECIATRMTMIIMCQQWYVIIWMIWYGCGLGSKPSEPRRTLNSPNKTNTHDERQKRCVVCVCWLRSTDFGVVGQSASLIRLPRSSYIHCFEI